MKRREALKLGLKTYHTNVPCKNGHLSERYTKNGTCVKCDKKYINDWRNSNRELYNEYHRYYDHHSHRFQKRKQKQTPIWNDDRYMENLLIECDHLHLSTNIHFSVCHIIPLISKKVCGLHVSYNLSIMSSSFQALKGNKFNQEKESNNYFKWLKERGL